MKKTYPHLVLDGGHHALRAPIHGFGRDDVAQAVAAVAVPGGGARERVQSSRDLLLGTRQGHPCALACVRPTLQCKHP